MATVKELKDKINNSNSLSGLLVPITIVLLGALIVFGISKMLSEERGYKDLVRELQSRTFGNKWVAAYELSKLITTKKIPAEDLAWVHAELIQLYSDAADQRTKNFLVVAVSAMENQNSFPFLLKALSDGDRDIQFAAVNGLARLPEQGHYDWSGVAKHLEKSEDEGLIQSILLCFAKHRVGDSNLIAKNFITHSNLMIRNAALTLLIIQGEKSLTHLVSESLEMRSGQGNQLTPDQVFGLKSNILTAIEKSSVSDWVNELNKFSLNDPDLRIQGRARELLNVLKK